MFRSVTKLAVIIQLRVNQTGSFKLRSKFTYFYWHAVQQCSLIAVDCWTWWTAV